MALTPEQRRARMDELKRERENRAAEQAKARAEADPMKNPTVRPAAQQTDPDTVQYYGWIGGATSGRWKLYEVNKNTATDAQIESAENRSSGGKTQATFSSSVGANTVVGPAGATLPPGPTTVTGPTLIPTTVTGPTLIPTTVTGPTLIIGPTNVGGPTLINTGLTAAQAASQSAFEIFRSFLNQYGIGALAADVEKYKLDGLSDDELLIRLRTESKAYKRRFAANEARVQKGLRALSEAEYIGLEDQYQDVMRRYGLPEAYYARGEMGRQEGFEKFIAGDVSPVEVEDRIQLAQDRVQNAPTEVRDALTRFYGAEITNGDVLAYMLDPDKALSQIQRKVTAAEIGAGAAMSGLATSVTRAEELGRYGVSGAAAREGFQTIAGILPRGSQLAEIYKQSPYTQTTAEQEVFGLAGAAEAGRQRRKLTELEQAAFSGSAGTTGGALARDRAGAF